MAKLKSGTRVYGDLLVDGAVDFTAVTLTTPVVGEIEYDGTSFYGVPSTNYGRGIVPLTSYTTGAGTAGSAATTDYPLFPAANDTITLPIGTYLVTLGLRVGNTGTNNSVALQINLRGGGGAIGSFSWRGTGTTDGAGTPTASNFAVAATALGTAFSVTGTSISGSKVYIVEGQGILKVTTAGTIIPSYRFASSAGGTTTLFADNHMILQQLDTQSAAAFGPSGAGWA